MERDKKYTAQVRIAAFKSAAKTFTSQDEADDWADKRVRELRSQAKRGGSRRDVTQFTVGDLNREFLADPKIKGQKSFHETERLIDWWTNKYASSRVLDFTQ